jgi:hypothetical protein
LIVGWQAKETRLEAKPVLYVRLRFRWGEMGLSLTLRSNGASRANSP